MADLLPLAVWDERIGDREALVAAKSALELTYLITVVTAVPGGPTRVLALHTTPNFICDFMLVRDPASTPDGMRIAMKWALDNTEDDERSVTTAEMLAAIIPGIREVHYEAWINPADDEPPFDPNPYPMLHQRFDPNDR